jgi:hypothetical protein
VPLKTTGSTSTVISPWVIGFIIHQLKDILPLAKAPTPVLAVIVVEYLPGAVADVVPVTV